MDGLGSVRGVVDSAIAPLESRLYSPYGEPYGTSGTSQTVYGFTGEVTDGNGLVNLRARYYKPTIGQFVSLDPLETPNLYQYVRSNPINWTDPAGLQENCIGPIPPYGEMICVPSAEEIIGTLENLRKVLEWLSEHLQGVPVGTVNQPVSPGASPNAEPGPVGPPVPDLSFPGLPTPGTLAGEVGADLDALRKLLEKVNGGCLTLFDAQQIANRSRTIANELTDEIQKTGKKCDSTVYRIQTANRLPDQSNASREFFDPNVAAQGAISVQIPGRLYVIFDNPGEVFRWLLGNRAAPNNYVISAKIDTRFVLLVRGLAYFQRAAGDVFTRVFGAEYGDTIRQNLPDIADPSHSFIVGPNGILFTSFGIPPTWIPAMIAAMCPETLKVRSRDEFLGGHEYSEWDR